MKCCAVSLTGDPITAGHRDVIKRAYRMFGRVVVLLAPDSGKKGALLGYDDRKALAEKALREDGVEAFGVYPIDGAAVDCAKRHGADVMVRGLRNEQDLVYEMDMSAVNRMLAPGVETVYLPCKPELSCVSSSAVRELARLGKFDLVEKFSSADAASLMKLRLTKTVAITGGIACGKSVAQKVFERRGWLGVDCDRLNRELLTDPAYCMKIASECARFGHAGVMTDKGVDRKKLADAVFGSPDVKKAVEAAAFSAIARRLAERLSGYGGGWPLRAVVQVPLLFDDGAEPFPFKFDKTVCVLSDRAEQLRRMRETRGYPQEEADRRLACQVSPETKAGKCDYVLRNDGSLAEFEAAVDRLAEELESSL